MKLVMIALAVACLALTGCGKKVAEKVIEASMAKQGVKGKVDLGNDQITIQTKEGTSTFSGGKGAKIPDTFPKDVFVYPGAKVLTAVTVPKGFNLVLETPDKLEQVVDAFKAKMTGAGWSEEMTMNQDAQAMCVYKKEKRQASIVVSTADKKTDIAITVAEGS